MAGDESGKELKALQGVNADFSTQPLSVPLTAPDVETGNYHLSLKLQPTEGEPIVKIVTVHIERGLGAQVTALKQRAAKLEANPSFKQHGALFAALPSARYRLSLYDLANAGDINFERLDFQSQFKEAAAMLDDLESSKDPFAGRNRRDRPVAGTQAAEG